MSLFISSFLPNGNYLIAADTRMSGSGQVKRDDFHKIEAINDHTFVFMSGVAEPDAIVVQAYKQIFREDYAREQLITLARAVMAKINQADLERELQTQSEVMVFFLVQVVGGVVNTGLYMGSRDFIPLEYPVSPGGVVVLGSYLPGTEDQIRHHILAAHSYDETIQAYRDVYNQQCRWCVGGNLEMYEISTARGLVKQISYKIIEKENNK